MTKRFFKGLVFFFFVALTIEIFLQFFGDRLPSRLNTFYLPPSKVYQQGQTVVLCLGDSVTAWGMEKSYPSYLQQNLDNISPGKFFVINAAKLGETSESMIGSLKEHLEKIRPGVVISMIGQNDYKLMGRTQDGLQIRLFSVLEHLFRVGINSVKGSVMALINDQPKSDAKEIFNPSAETWAATEEQIRVYLSDGKSLPAYHDVLDYLSDEGARKSQKAYYLAIELASEALKTWPQDQILADYRALAAASLPGHPEAENYLRFAYRLGTHHQLVYIYFAKQLKKAGKRDEALQVAKELVSSTDEIGVRNKEIIEKEFPELKSEENVVQLKLQPEQITALNYKKVYDLLSEHRIPLIILPYPNRDLAETKKLLDGSTQLQFVDYQNFFADSKTAFDEYFVDKSAVDFGHLTPKSAEFIAQLLTEAVLRLTTNEIKQESSISR